MSRPSIPKGPHYAILIFDTVSYTESMGHGYGHTQQSVDTCTYLPYTDRKLWEMEIRTFHHQGKNFIAFHVDAIAKIDTQVSIGIDI